MLVHLLIALCCALMTAGSLATAPSSHARTAIDARHAQLGGAGGRLGPPTGAEFCGLRNGGCQRNYQRGVIVWSPATGAQPSYGAIGQTWRAHGSRNGRFGYPTGPEVCGLRGGGCYQNYQGGSIIWSPTTGARISVGAIRARWASTNFENGALGYPISDESCSAGACKQRYQRGVITWTARGGTVLSRDIDVAASSVVVVNKRRMLNPAGYTPGPLVNVGGSLLRSDAAQQFTRLLADARAAGVAMVPVSGYRSFATQASLYASYVNRYGQARADLISARPGYSEHQTGLAIDIGNRNGSCGLQECFAGTPAGAWAAQNAWRYGFIIRYPQGRTSTTGYAYEPWHLRYVGTTISSEMRAHRLPTLEHYLSIPAAPSY
ncbi:D-alanyl-D-alanine carboxypeptidase family protein [Arthrobacter sp. SX1312]|uniref:D-alanyl-D-alanine carboxypeptidase family protein n=1 Tax=Arthrobacter sp. SX1312 TaxID=2058896 RepID=UPI000CE343C1|nr:D-alanyl-D-alanine carboxypeptidase family protein [Arthrobacter sp. SX1312]